MSTNTWGWILSIWAVMACLAWCFIYGRAINNCLALPLLSQLDPKHPDRWPLLSVIIPACNEADTIEMALSTLLEQDYPNLEIILVDDRSTDNTARVVTQKADSDSRLQLIKIKHLPPGWLGKVHALHKATEYAKGEWLLFTDADVHFQPGVLQKTVSLCLDQQLDHLSMIPDLFERSFWHNVTLSAFSMTFLATIRASQIGKPDAESYVGIGAFNLVRKTLLDQTKGFAWLKMEVADDLGLGLMLNQAGAKQCLVVGVDAIGLTWYPSLSRMFAGLEKNLFGITSQ